VQKTGKTDRPREYIPVGLSTNHAGWDSQWFYLRNDDNLLPAYSGRLITERPADWTYGVVQAHQTRLVPLLDALKKLHLEGLTAALVLSAVHHRRVLPLMSRPLRMDEMGPGVSSRDLEACRMSNEAPANDEVTARVRAAIAGDFKPEHVNGFPMRPDAGSIDLVCSLLVHSFDSRSLSSLFLSLPLFWQGRIDVRSSRPPEKEDEVDRDKRRQSAEKLKSAKDSKKKGETKRNLDRQALDTRQAKSRQRGSLKKNPLVTMTAGIAATIARTPRGWRLASIGSSRVRLGATSMPHGRERRRRGQADFTAPVLTPILCPRPVRPPRTPDPLVRQRQVARLSPRRRGR